MSPRLWQCVVLVLLAFASAVCAQATAPPASAASSTATGLLLQPHETLQPEGQALTDRVRSREANRRIAGLHRRAQASQLTAGSAVTGGGSILVEGPGSAQAKYARVHSRQGVAATASAPASALHAQQRRLLQAQSNATQRCVLELSGRSETFDACTTLSGTPGAYTFHWSLQPGNRLRGAIDSVNAGGYTGWGVGSQRGSRMVPGNGIIVKADKQAASGASVADYTLGGYRTAEVTRPSSWKVSDMKAAALGDRLLALFTLQLEADEDLTSFPVIYTMGPVQGGVLIPHDSRNGNTVELDLTSSAADVVVEPTNSGVASSHRSLTLAQVHGWLNGIGLGLMLPLAALIARTLREHPKAWFNVHRILAVTGFTMGVVGIGIGYYMRPFLGSEEKAHAALGTLVLVFGMLQVLAGVLRPDQEHKRRHLWALLHHSNGRLLIIIIVVNYYIGVHMSTHLSGSHRRNWYAAFSLVLGVIVALGMAKEVYNAIALRRKQQAYAGSTAIQMSKAPGPPDAGDSRLITDGSYSHQYAGDIT